MWGKMPLKYIVDKNKSTFEIDLVGVDSITKQNILFCEVKWQDDVNAKAVAEMLIQKAKYVKWGLKNRLEEFIIVAKSFSNKIDQIDNTKIACLDLNDLNSFLK
jgi:hypothetical protein